MRLSQIRCWVAVVTIGHTAQIKILNSNLLKINKDWHRSLKLMKMARSLLSCIHLWFSAGSQKNNEIQEKSTRDFMKNWVIGAIITWQANTKEYSKNVPKNYIQIQLKYKDQKLKELKCWKYWCWIKIKFSIFMNGINILYLHNRMNMLMDALVLGHLMKQN